MTDVLAHLVAWLCGVLAWIDDVLAPLGVWLNTIANALGWLLTPVGVLPGWLSTTLIAAVTGVLLLIVFKYTSNQRAIKRVRDDISANLLALKLYKDSVGVAVRAQGRLLLNAGWLLVLGLLPTAVMFVPVTLALVQLGLWYQQRPLKVGEETLVTVKLNGDAEALLPEVKLEPTRAVKTTVGPVRVFSAREVCWTVKARKKGYHRLVFRVGDRTVEKELAVGGGFMRVSARRPARVLSDVLLNPAEEPFGADSPVRSIEVDYPERSSWTSATDSWLLCWFSAAMTAAGWLGSFVGAPAWMIYWFVGSLVAALCFRRVFNVNF
jgi:hypothetical protein